MALTATVISLNGRPRIRVMDGRYLVGYYRTMSEIERAGIKLADLAIEPRTDGTQPH